MKSGWQTSEFWVALISQALSLLVIAGVITSSDRSTLEGALSSSVTAVFVLVTTAHIVGRYIMARTTLKLQNQATPAPVTSPQPPDS